MPPFLRSKPEAAVRKARRARGKAVLHRHASLWPLLNEYRRQTRSTGCGWHDYATLNGLLRHCRPSEVLECRTGVLTLVIGQSLLDNDAETGMREPVTSTEEFEEWFDLATRLLPATYRAVVDFQLSDTVEDSYSMFRGVRYRSVPDRPYGFVFVDGPKYRSPVDGTPTFDFDYQHVLRSSEAPVAALMDKRVNTCFALQQLLGTRKVRRRPIKGLGVVKPCARRDRGVLAGDRSSTNFAATFRLLGLTHLRMEPIAK